MENNRIYRVGTRGLSLLLALAMLLSCVNITAFAESYDAPEQGETVYAEAPETVPYEVNESVRFLESEGEMTWSDLRTAFENGDVVLTNDVTAESGDSPLQVPASGTVIDLNGYTLDGSALSADYVISGSHGGTLVIKDSGASHTGVIRGGTKGNISLDNPASCRLLGGTLAHESIGVRLGHNTNLYLSGRPEAKGVIVMHSTAHVDVEGQLFTAFRLAPDPSVLPTAYGSTTPLSNGSVTSAAADLFEIWTYAGDTETVTRNEVYSCVRDAQNRLAAAKNYSISFDANGGSGSMSGKAHPGSEYILPACAFAPPAGKAFSGWKVGDDPTIKNPFDRITVNGDVTVTAQWRDATAHTLTLTEAQDGVVEAWVPYGQDAQTKLESGSAVAPGVQVTLKILPDEGKLLNGLQHGNVSLSRDCRWFAGKDGAPYTETVFTMPEEDVTITPAFGAVTDGLYIDMPASNLSVTIPADVQTLQIRQGGGKQRTVKLSFNGPTGKGMSLTGTVATNVTGNSLKVLGETYGSEGKTNVSAFTLSGNMELNYRYTAGSFEAFDLTLDLGNFNTLGFDPNGGTGSMKSVQLPVGSRYTLPPCGFTHPDGFTFAGWSVNGETKNPGDIITAEGGLTLKAMWSLDWSGLQSIIDSAAGPKTIVLPGEVTAPDGAARLSVPGNKTITIDLNGHGINRALSAPREDGMVFLVQGKLTICDSVGTGRITGGWNSGNGGGVYVDGENAEFILTGGSVSGNTAGSHGGGVFVTGLGCFDARGGSVAQNRAGTAGGGVYVVGPAASGGSLHVSGNPVIQGNKKGTGDEGSDVGLDTSLKISIVGALTDGALIGVDAESGEVAAVTTSAAIDDPSVSFFSNLGAGVFRNAQNYVCFEKEHTANALTWEWTGHSAATLNMKCGTCGKVLWAEPAEITGPAFIQSASSEIKGTLRFTATAAHGGESYTAEKSSAELTPVLVPNVAPGVSSNGIYSLGTQAYYTVSEGGDTYLFAPSADNPNRVGDLLDHTQPLSYFVFNDSDGMLDHFVIERYTGPLADGTVIELPKMYQGKPCTVIGDGTNSFFEAASGHSISIRSTETIVEIADNAFKNLTALTAFAGSTAGLTQIGAGAFQNSGVTALTLDAEKPVTIADSAFSGNAAISAKHSSGLVSVAGQYNVTLSDHEYCVVHDQTKWNENPVTITIRCVKDCGNVPCGESHTLNASVTQQAENKIAAAVYNDISYTDEENSYQIILRPGLGSGEDVVFQTNGSYTLPSVVTSFTAPAGAELTNWTSGSTTYSPGTEFTPTENMVFTAVWASNWTKVSQALSAGEDVTLLNDIQAGSDETCLTVPAGQSITLNMNGHTIDRALNTAESNGCVLNVAGTLYLRNGTVKGGNNSGDGGALSVSGSLVMEGVTLTENRAKNGGGIYLAAGGSALLFGSAVITNNRARAAGGGVFFSDSSTRISLEGDVRIHDNYGDGDALFDNLNAPNNTALNEVFSVGAGGLASSSLIGASGEVLTAILAAAGVTVATLGVIRLIRDSERTDVTQKEKCSGCQHRECDVTWEWSGDYRSAVATAICQSCHGVMMQTISSTATLDESTKKWKYTVSAFGATNTRETEPYTVTLQSGLADMRTALSRAEQSEAAALLNKLPATADNVVVQIPHKQGQPGVYILPVNPWTELAGFWAFGGWKLGSEVLFADKVVPINGPTMFNADWKCEVAYDPTNPNDADPQPTDGERLMVEVVFGAEHELRPCNWTRDSHDFESWKLNMGGVPVDRRLPGTPILVYASTIVTANWDSKWGTLNKQLQAGPVQSKQLSEDLVAMSKDYALTVPTERTFMLDLHGKALDRAMSGNPVSLDGSALHVKGQMTILDTTVDIYEPESVTPGAVTGGKAAIGGGVRLESGNVALTGGSISGNTALMEGGGAYINAGSTFYMEKTVNLDKAVCEISGNTANTNGGGVFVASTGVLNIGDGSRLSGNTAELGGGGAYISGSVTVSGSGTIDGNTAKADGGGAFIAQGGSLALNGNAGIEKPLTISGNSAPGNGAGVFVGGTLSVAGTVNISGNTISDGSQDDGSDNGGSWYDEGQAQPAEECNVYLPDGKRITIAGALTQTPQSSAQDNGEDEEPPAPQGTYIGVTVQTPPSEANPNPVRITDGLMGKGSAENFGSDDTRYMIAIDERSGEAVLCLPTILKFEKGFEDTAAGEDPNNNPMPDWTVGRGVLFELPYCAFTRPGWRFVAWQLGSDEAALYAPGATILAEGAVMTLTAVWEASEPIFYANKLVLDGVLDLQYYIKVPDNVQGKSMTFSIYGQPDQYIPFEYVEQPDTETGCYIFTCKVYAYQMADTINAVFAYEENGETKTVSNDYSVKAYLDSLNMEDAKTRDVVNAMRNYGHYVQPYLKGLGTADYETPMPAAGIGVDVRHAADGSREKADEQQMNTYINRALISRARIRLNVNTGTDLVFELKPADGVSGQLTASINGEDCLVETTDYGMQRVAKMTIAANNMDCIYSFTVRMGNQIAFTCSASIMHYINLVLAQNGDDNERMALAALYEYWKAASAYASAAGGGRQS